MAKAKSPTETKKKGSSASLEQEVVLNLMRTNDRVQIRLSRLFREHGLTESQFNILRILRSEGKSLPILEIASRTITVVPGITGLIDRLEKASFVERERSKDDRRVVNVSLTSRGTTVLSQLDTPVNKLHSELIGHLSQTELNELNRLLEKARESMVDVEAE